jgi:hypothetical protein
MNTKTCYKLTQLDGAHAVTALSACKTPAAHYNPSPTCLDKYRICLNLSNFIVLLSTSTFKSCTLCSILRALYDGYITIRTALSPSKLSSPGAFRF